jgi:predicted nucleic acid-binding protein
VLPVARSIVIQMQMVIRLFRIDVVDLTASTVQAQLLQQELYLRSIRAADSLHVMTAISVGADILVSGDDAILQLDGVLKNISGNTLRCLDSDGALRLI